MAKSKRSRPPAPERDIVIGERYYLSHFGSDAGAMVVATARVTDRHGRMILEVEVEMIFGDVPYTLGQTLRTHGANLHKMREEAGR